MAAEFTAVAEQTVNPGEAIIFTTDTIPCRYGAIRHRPGTGLFMASGGQRNRRCCCCCCCNMNDSKNYLVSFGANIAIPTGGTVGAISVAAMVEGNTIPGTLREVTPAAVETYSPVAITTIAQVWSGCCESISIRNTSDQPILVRNANIIFEQ